MTMEQLVVENSSLIYSIIYKYFSNYKDKEDLFQEGAKEMINKYPDYDSNMGAKFSTYIYPHIYFAINKYVRRDKGIKISRNLTKLYLQIDKAFIVLSQQLMREPSIEELANFLELSEVIVADAINSTYPISSIDESFINDGKELSILDTIGKVDYENLEELIMLKDEIEKLSPLERDLINMRYMKDQTQQETADLLDMSQVQVYRKEQKVLTKLKNKLVA